MKNAKRILLLVLCAALLVGATITGTVAYLTSQQTVTNTFTAGKVAITMTESDVNEYGVPVENAPRVLENEYLLVPGHTYKKDPIVYVAANSEPCYVFVKIDNGIASYIDVENLENQLETTNGWKKLPGVGNVWYKECGKNTADVQSLPVFNTFTVKTNADAVAGWANIASDTNDIVVTAYAIQKSNGGTGGFTPEAAWKAVNP